MLGVISLSSFPVNKTAQFKCDSMNCVDSTLHHFQKHRQENRDLHECADALEKWGLL